MDTVIMVFYTLVLTSFIGVLYLAYKIIKIESWLNGLIEILDNQSDVQESINVVTAKEIKRLEELYCEMSSEEEEYFN